MCNKTLCETKSKSCMIMGVKGESAVRFQPICQGRTTPQIGNAIYMVNKWNISCYSFLECGRIFILESYCTEIDIMQS